MARVKPFRCPVCRAKFRATRECSRCGADLSKLMQLAVMSRICRRKARKAVQDHEFKNAYDFAKKAQRLHETEKGHGLLRLTAWLNAPGPFRN